MVLKEYIYFVAFILNCVNFLKSYKRSIYSSIFFISMNLVFMFVFNFVFDFMVEKFNIVFLNIKFLSLIFVVSILLYFLKRKYVCITFSGTLVYFICRILNIEIIISEIIFLISILHIFEGIFIIFSLNNKMYLPLVLNKFPIIFMIFYSRKFENYTSKCIRFISGILIFIYGIIVLFINVFKNNIFSLILICILHESIILIENFIVKKVKEFNGQIIRE